MHIRVVLFQLLSLLLLSAIVLQYGNMPSYITYTL